MSDSEDLSSAPNIPADVEIEQCIRTVVREAVKKDETVTVKLARTRAEEKLGLEEGFLKDNAQWKQRSKDLISATFDEPPSPEVKRAKPPPKAGTKRKSDEPQPSSKKARKSAAKHSEDETVDNAGDRSDVDDSEDTPANGKTNQGDSSGDASDPEEEGQPKTESRKIDAAEDEESDLSSVIDDPPPKKKRQKKALPKAPSKPNPPESTKTSKTAVAVEEDESDLSSVLDEPQPKKSRKKKSTSPKPKAKATTTKTLSPDEEEIKRLQSWLLKCGIRKLWHRELASFETDKAKIKHLKTMLEEAGMSGRPSAEKARQIKEARELKAELEAATEFNKTWGHDGDDGGGDGKDDVDGGGVEEEEKPAPGRRARPKGFVDFGDSDEESE